MKSYLLLLKLNLLNLRASLLDGSIRKANGKPDVSRIILYGLALLGLAMMLGMIVWLEVTLYGALAPVRMEGLLFGLAILLSMIITLFFGVPQTLASLYFSKDTTGLAHLPLSSRTAMAAKWTEVYLLEAMMDVGLLLPLIILHALRNGGGFLYWLQSLTVMLAVPLYPLALSLLLAALMARLTSLTKHKDAWITIGTFLMVFVILGLEWSIMPAIPNDADEMYFLRLMTDNEALLNLVIGAFPPVLWAVHALQGSIGAWAAFVLTGLGAIALLIFLIGRSYLNDCLRHTEHAASKRERRSTRIRRRSAYEPRSPFAAIFRRELSEILRVPNYFINSLMGVLMPVIMLVGAGVGASSEEEGAAMVQAIPGMLSGLSDIDMTLIIAAFLSFVCWICTLPATCVSREGKRLQITRMIPVPARTILSAKLAVSMTFNMLGSIALAGAVVFLLGGAFLPHAAAAVLLVTLLSYATGVVNMAADAVKPSLNWRSENEAIKQNMNSMFGMLYATLMIALAIVPPILLAVYTDVPPLARLGCVSGVLLAECAVAFLLMRRVVEPRYAALEP